MEQVRVIVASAPFSSYAMNGALIHKEQLLAHSVLMNEYFGKTVYLIDAELDDPNLIDYREDRDKTPHRHFGRMNVLFGDGHVELVEPDEFFDPEALHWQVHAASPS
jgi:prepilin-type processing-associated H-X9-DG protein